MAQAAAKPSRVGVSEADIEFLERFETCVLPESEWSHLAHVRVAWTCLVQSSVMEAITRIRRGILRYNTDVLSRRHKYHETVTIALAKLVSDRMLVGECWDDFRTRIDDILDAETPILSHYYSKALLSSGEARTKFVEPDLNDLPQYS